MEDFFELLKHSLILKSGHLPLSLEAQLTLDSRVQLLLQLGLEIHFGLLLLLELGTVSVDVGHHRGDVQVTLLVDLDHLGFYDALKVHQRLDDELHLRFQLLYNRRQQVSGFFEPQLSWVLKQALRAADPRTTRGCIVVVLPAAGGLLTDVPLAEPPLTRLVDQFYVAHLGPFLEGPVRQSELLEQVKLWLLLSL